MGGESKTGLKLNIRKLLQDKAESNYSTIIYLYFHFENGIFNNLYYGSGRFRKEHNWR